MNLFQLNSGVGSRVLQNATFDISRYIDFINKSIDFLKRETFEIKVSCTITESGKKYSPDPPSDKKAEKAIELLFKEDTKAVFDQRKNFKHYKEIRIVDQSPDENYFTLESDIEGDTIYLKPDIYQLEQQKRALLNLRDYPLKEHQPLLNLFGFADSNVWYQQFVHQEFPWKILTDTARDGVLEQREFVSKAFQTKDFALMEGPPGSGKTTTIIELIMQYAAEGKRILLCSATHAAIDNVIERIKGRYKNICDSEIIPVRISAYDKSVKESVRPYLLGNLVKTTKKDIEKHLKSNQLLESQKYLFANLNIKDEKNADPIEKIILDSANLVAGTMIGILQHPDIKANKQGANFDVLIVDEASKVTFTDFIVPALHARKWILVGDVKQLSPYVENDYVSENIATLVDENTQKAIVKQFELLNKLNDKKYDDCLKVFFTENPPENENLLRGNGEICVETVDENWQSDEKSIIKLNSADVVIAKNDYRIRQLLANHIHVKSIFINGESSGIQQQYKQKYFRRANKKPQPYLFDSRQDEWSELVASRLNQSFSFRNAVGFENIDLELSFLIPDDFKMIKEKKGRDGIRSNEEVPLSVEINQIKRLVFPSILELLQNGVGKSPNQRSNRLLSDGFHEPYKQSRFVSLSYQHRMHPDIARTSRENFYDNNLLPANAVLQDQGWKYADSEPVVKWIHNNYRCNHPFNKNKAELEQWFAKHNNQQKKEYKTALKNFLTWVNGKIFNPREIDDMCHELEKFLSWSKDNPKPDGEKYEVAVLTFYLNQESELRKRIRKITRQPFHSKFYMHNADIFLYTVDKFQGQEAVLVLLGFTKSSPDAHFNSPNRLNVALTRARNKLILFGNRKWFKEKSKLKALRELATNFESIIRL